MRMYVVFIILLQNNEKAVDGHSYRFFCKGLGFNYLEALSLNFLKVIYSTWVSVTPRTFIMEEELIHY